MGACRFFKKNVTSIQPVWLPALGLSKKRQDGMDDPILSLFRQNMADREEQLAICYIYPWVGYSIGGRG